MCVVNSIVEGIAYCMLLKHAFPMLTSVPEHPTCTAAVRERKSLDFLDISTLHSRSNKANTAAPKEICVLHSKKTKAMNVGKSEK